jgi:hypothetical protein
MRLLVNSWVGSYLEGNSEGQAGVGIWEGRLERRGKLKWGRKVSFIVVRVY